MSVWETASIVGIVCSACSAQIHNTVAQASRRDRRQHHFGCRGLQRAAKVSTWTGHNMSVSRGSVATGNNKWPRVQNISRIGAQDTDIAFTSSQSEWQEVLFGATRVGRAHPAGSSSSPASHRCRILIAANKVWLIPSLSPDGDYTRLASLCW